MVELCDFGLPQGYFGYQGKRWSSVRADHRGKPIIATFSPRDWEDGWSLEHTAQALDGAVGLWVYPDVEHFGQQVSALRPHALIAH